MGSGAAIPTAATHAALTLLTTERHLCDPPWPIPDEPAIIPEATPTAGSLEQPIAECQRVGQGNLSIRRMQGR